MKRVSTALLDREFSLFIRRRDAFTCQRCSKQYPENSSGLHASHFIGRVHRATRWDPDNVDALDWGCHQYFETHKATAYLKWKLEQLGEERFNELVARGSLVKKWSRDELTALRASLKERLAS